MSTSKPLKLLLDQADALIKSAQPTSMSKSASTQDDEVSALVSTLAGADSEVIVEHGDLAQEELDKIAESYNRLQAAAEIDELHKLAAFEKKAIAEGYTEDQISEAFSKVAASKLAKTLPALTAMGFLTSTADANSLPKKGTLGKVLARQDLTKSQGGLA